MIPGQTTLLYYIAKPFNLKLLHIQNYSWGYKYKINPNTTIF